MRAMYCSEVPGKLCFTQFEKWIERGQKMDASFSSAAMAHTFSRLAARETCYKNFISVCHQSHVVRSCKCCFEELGSAKVAKHWKSKKICGMSI